MDVWFFFILSYLSGLQTWQDETFSLDISKQYTVCVFSDSSDQSQVSKIWKPLCVYFCGGGLYIDLTRPGYTAGMKTFY